MATNKLAVLGFVACILVAAVSANSAEPTITPDAFRLELGQRIKLGQRINMLEHRVKLFRTDDPDHPVASFPIHWLRTGSVDEEDRLCPDLHRDFAPSVTSFSLGDGRVGLHLSSYRPAEPGEGSMQLACGSDLFLVYDPDSGTLERLVSGLGITKMRVRGICSRARFTHFRLIDIKGDGLTDIAATRERAECVHVSDDKANYDEFETRRVRDRTKWFPLHRSGLITNPFDPNRGRDLPLIGLTRTPVDEVMAEVEGGGKTIKKEGRRRHPFRLEPSEIRSIEIQITSHSHWIRGKSSASLTIERDQGNWTRRVRDIHDEQGPPLPIGGLDNIPPMGKLVDLFIAGLNSAICIGRHQRVPVGGDGIQVAKVVVVRLTDETHIRLRSKSHYREKAPWNITRGQDRIAVTDEAVDMAISGMVGDYYGGFPFKVPGRLGNVPLRADEVSCRSGDD